MKLPERIRRLLVGSTPSPEEYLAQAASERRQQEFEAKLARVERLRPFVGKLLLVTDCGFRQDAHIARLTHAIVGSEIYDARTPIGISAHIMLDRPREGRLWQQRTATDLSENLRASGLDVLPLDIIFNNGRHDWLETIISASENTAERSDMEPNSIGHIAIVDAVAMKMADIDPFELRDDNGAAYRLSGVGEQATLSWSLLTANMG